MVSKEESKQVYIARINWVMDYINNNIDSTIDLSVMANIALFSPYHFHRIFTFITGETPKHFLLRIRLEKVASHLQNNTKDSIQEIAFQYGFTNISSFSRAFKSYFKINAKEFRKLDKAIFIKNGIRYSKNGKLISKISKNIEEKSDHICYIKQNELVIMNTKIEIKQMPELHLIYCRHMGAFNKIGLAYDKLFKWATPKNLITPTTKTVTVYQDDPSVTDIEKVRQDACITVENDVKVEGEIGKSTVPGGKYAVGHFEINENEFEKSWNTMCLWLTESGYQPSGSCSYELYHNNHDEHPEKKFILDICIPIKPL